MESKETGVTLLEIVVAMGIIALTSAAILGGFVFSRRINWRSESELRVAEFTQRVTEQLRSLPNLNPGIYVNPGYDKDPTTPDDPATPYDEDPSTPATDPFPASKNLCNVPVTVLAILTVPEQLRHFNTRVRCYVEDHRNGSRTEPPCRNQNPGRGINFNPLSNPPQQGQDDQVDIRWTKVMVDWDVPQQ